MRGLDKSNKIVGVKAAYLKIVLTVNGFSVVNGLVLLCADSSGFTLLAPGAVLAGCGLMVVMSGILLAKAGVRRARQNERTDMSKCMYLGIVLLIITGCFLTTFGVAFALSATLGC